jgi:hypothetical protein
MIIAHELPFSIVKHASFRSFLASLQPKFRLMSWGTVKTDVMQIFQSMKAQIMVEIGSIDRVALTTDLWTASTQAPFMVISAHFILPDWSLKKRLISFKELPTPHTGLAISDQLIASIIEWKIMDKVAFVTVDNASLNNVAISRLSGVLNNQSKNPPLLKCKFLHIRCAAHVINLVVKDGFKEISTAITRVREIV